MIEINYKYCIKGLSTQLDAETIIKCLTELSGDIGNFDVFLEDSEIAFEYHGRRREYKNLEKSMSDKLAELGYELITPPNISEYSYVGDKQRKTRQMPVCVAVSLIVVFSVICILTTYICCEFGYLINKGQSNGNINNTPNIPSSSDLSPYMQDVATLDAIFNALSYDGVDKDEIQTALLKAYIDATGDVYAEYLTQDEFDEYNSEKSGEFVGIGVSIVNNEIEINGYKYKVLEVISVFRDSPAMEGGVNIGDCIMYVGKGEDKILVSELGHSKALDMLLGEAGTKAEFVVFRPSDDEYIEFSIARKKVESETVTYKISKTNSQVGIVSITGFDRTTPGQFTTAVDSLKELGCNYFVFDVRNNPGGMLDSIESVLSFFLNEGDLIVSTEYKDKTNNQFRYVKTRKYSGEDEVFNISKDDIGKYKDLDCIVITNGNTASAAELFTATMRDYGIAKIVGEKTYGKGCMQTYYPLQRYGIDGWLKLTVAMYFSKSHTDYHGTGIVPDYSVELDDEAKEYNMFLLPEEKDDQLMAAISKLVK